jgi:hypothetical protein
VLALDRLFFFAALGGGALFVIQLVLLFVGTSADVDIDADLPDGGDMGHAGADASFKVLSLQGITSFVMMFGLVGWAMRNDSLFDPLPSLAGAFVAGGASTWVMGRIFRSFQKLQSSGTFDIKKAEGAKGVVYLNVAPDKPGKVNVTVGNRLLTFEAITEGKIVLETGTAIVIKRIISDTTVCVEKD